MPFNSLQMQRISKKKIGKTSIQAFIKKTFILCHCNHPSPTSLSFLYIHKYIEKDRDMKSEFYCLEAKVFI